MPVWTVVVLNDSGCHEYKQYSGGSAESAVSQAREAGYNVVAVDPRPVHWSV